MPQVNQIQNLLLAQAPPNVRAQAEAGEDAVQRAAAPTGPYTSRTAGLLKALQGGLGGLMESSAINQAMQGQRDGNVAGMDFLRHYQQGLGQASGSPQSGTGAAPSAAPAAAPASQPGQGGAGSDYVAGKQGASHAAWIASIMPQAQRISAQTGIDARLIAAQAAHESDFGHSAPGGNLFGIKGAGSGPISTMESINGVMTPTKASFAAYDSPAASFDGYGKLMSGSRYAGVRNGQGLDAQLDALGKSGYATDPNYAAKVGAIARGIQVPSANPSGTTTASASMPAANAQPVASNTLPPGITPDMVSAAPQSDGSVRGDLLAAAAQHGALNPDAPAPNATPTGMTGLPPGVTAPAGAGPGAPGPAVAAQPSAAPPLAAPAAPPAAPFDPEGTGAGNYDPNAAPLMGTSGSALAQALQNYKPPLGQAQAAVVPPPVSASAPPAPNAPSVLPGPLAMPSGDTAGPASVPPPQGAMTPPPAPQSDGSLRGDLMAAMQQHDPVGAAQMQGQDVALDPTVPDPQGSLVPAAPSSPNDALVGPQSDAAAGGAALGMGGPAVAPQASLPDAPPLPPPGAQSLQGPADAASAAAAAAGPELDPEGTGAANYTPGPEPTLRDQLMAAMGGGGATGPQSDASAPLAPVGVDQSAGPAPIAALGATPNAQPVGATSGPGASPPPGGPGSPPLPMMAQAGAPGPTPMPPQPGTGAALPATGPTPPLGGQTAGAGASLPQNGPMPPPGAQTLAAAGPNPNAPAPGAVQAGPQPMPPTPAGTSPMAAALAPQQFGGSGTNAPAGNSPSADPSSAQNFMRQEAMRAAGGAGAPTPGGFMAGIMGAGTAARGQGAPGSGILGMGGPALGGAPQPGQGSAPAGGAGQPYQQGTPDQARAIAQQTQANPSAAPASQAMAGQVMSATGGQGGGSGGQPNGGGAQGGQGSFGGQISPELYAQGMAVMNNYYASPEMKSAVMQRLFPQMQTKEMPDGTFLGYNPNTMETHVLYQGQTKHFDATKTGLIYDQYTGQASNGAGGAGGNGFRPATPAERAQYGVTDDRPMYFGPGGQPEFGQPGTAGQGETEEAKKAGGAAADRRNDMISAANAAPEKIARLKLLGTVLDNTATGPLAPEIGNAGAIATRLGIAPERMAALGIDPNQPVNNAIANKLAGEMTMSSIGAKNGGMPASNFSIAERQFIEGLYPNIENQAGGNRAVTDVLTAVEQKKMQWADAWSGYKDQQAQAGRPLSYENFEDGFRRAHSQDNIFAPIMQKYQAGGYTPTAPNPGGVPNAAPAGQGQGGAPSMAQQPAPSAPQAPGQGGGYLPGAARGAPSPAQGGMGQGGAPSPTQGGQSAPPQQQGGHSGQRPGAPAPSDAIAQAQAAIARGAPRAAVMQRLQGMGISTAGM